MQNRITVQLGETEQFWYAKQEGHQQTPVGTDMSAGLIFIIRRSISTSSVHKMLSELCSLFGQQKGSHILSLNLVYLGVRFLNYSNFVCHAC